MSITRPVQISEFQQTIKTLDDNELQNLKLEVTKSINKLNESILLMVQEKHSITSKFATHHLAAVSEEELLNEDDEDTSSYKSDLKLYNESIQENRLVVRNSHQRIDALDVELARRGLPTQGTILTLQQLAASVGTKFDKDVYSEAETLIAV